MPARRAQRALERRGPALQASAGNRWRQERKAERVGHQAFRVQYAQQAVLQHARRLLLEALRRLVEQVPSQ